MPKIIGTESLSLERLIALAKAHAEVYYYIWEPAEIYAGDREELANIEVNIADILSVEIEGLIFVDDEPCLVTEYGDVDVDFYLTRELAEEALRKEAAFVYKKDDVIFGYDKDEATVDMLYDAQKEEEIAQIKDKCERLNQKCYRVISGDFKSVAIASDPLKVAEFFYDGVTIQEISPEEFASHCGSKTYLP